MSALTLGKARRPIIGSVIVAFAIGAGLTASPGQAAESPVDQPTAVQPAPEPLTPRAVKKEGKGSISVTLSANEGNSNRTTIFKGKVNGDIYKNGSVQLQRKKGSKWAQVASTDYRKRSFTVKYPTRKGAYRIKVHPKTWYNTKKWYVEEYNQKWAGPSNVYSNTVNLTATKKKLAHQFGGNKVNGVASQWVVGMGDSYMSGEGATYAGYGPQCGADHTSWNPTSNCSSLSNTDDWWVSTFGANLEETYPGDWKQPIAQPGLGGDLSKYVAPVSGHSCHRSASASMYWNNANYAAMNLACSGAVGKTNVATGKPGVDFVEANNPAFGTITGQALQLQRFATTVKANGGSIKTIQLSIGGNDVHFSDIVKQCVQDYVVPLSKPCSQTPGSAIVEGYANGTGLTAARDAVRNGTQNIITAMDNAGFPQGSYTIAVHTYPIGVPPSSQIEKDFGGDSDFGRLFIGGCGFRDADLDFVNGPFAELLTKRVIEGASQTRGASPAAALTVMDIRHIFDDHQVCSEFVDYPKTYSFGNNGADPLWAADWGGQQGSWASPIIAIWDPTNVPTLAKALEYGPSGPPPGGASTVEASSGQLAMHPNYWGQRAISKCAQDVTTKASSRGFVNHCAPKPGKQSLDAYGRPLLNITRGAAL